MTGLFDMHAHILPNVDDGAKNIEESIKLLQMLKEQGVTHVITTPHFYPLDNNLEDYVYKTERAYGLLQKHIADSNLPKVYLGCEMLYYPGIGRVTSLSQFCLNDSDFLLLELADNSITNNLFSDIKNIKKNFGITVIIAHIERYYKNKNYRKLLKFIESENIPTQVNASSFFIPYYKRAAIKLIKKGIASVISTDTHSIEHRPPLYTAALKEINNKIGKEAIARLLKNSELLFNKIILKE